MSAWSPKQMTTRTQNSGPAVGRRVSSELYGNKLGTVVKVRPPGIADVYPSYDVAFDDGTGVERVAFSLITGSSWKILPTTIGQKDAGERHFAYLHEKLRQRTELARQRIADQPGAPVSQPNVSFYRPSDSFVSASDVTRIAAAPGVVKLAAKALREVLARELEGVRINVQTKGDVLHVTWLDGPVYIGRLTDRFTAGRAGAEAGPVAGRVVTKREISNELVDCAIEYVRQMIGEPLRGITAPHFQEGNLRDVYPRSGPYSGMSIGGLVRLALMRWDDHDMRFVGEGLTRAMVLENETLFPGKDMVVANNRMRLIRRQVGELNIESAAMEEAVSTMMERHGG